MACNVKEEQVDDLGTWVHEGIRLLYLPMAIAAR